MKEGAFVMQQKQIEKERFHYLSKYNHVIQSNILACSTSDLSSINAMRLFVSAISTIRNKNLLADTEDKEFYRTRFTVADYKKIFGLKGNAVHKQIEDATEELYNSSLYTYDKANDIYGKHHIMKSCLYYNNEGFIEFIFDKDLMPYLLQLNEKYTDIPLQYFIGFKSVNSINLLVFLFSKFNLAYHNAIKQAKEKSQDKVEDIKANFHYTITVSVKELMQLFMSNSFYLYKKTNSWGKLKYDSFSKLNDKAIEPSVKEIQKSGILKIERRNLRNNVKKPRNVSHVEFSVTVGENMIGFNKQKKEHSKELKEHKELERVAEYFMNRFNTYQGYVINFANKNNYSSYVMKLSAILLQSYLEANSYGRYVPEAWRNNEGLTGIRCKDPFRFLSKTFDNMSFIEDINDEDKAIDKYCLKSWVGDMPLEEELRNPLFKKEINELFDKVLQSTYNNPNEYYYD